MTMTVARASDRRPLGARRARAHVRGRNNPRQIPRREMRVRTSPCASSSSSERKAINRSTTIDRRGMPRAR